MAASDDNQSIASMATTIRETKRGRKRKVNSDSIDDLRQDKAERNFDDLRRLLKGNLGNQTLVIGMITDGNLDGRKNIT